jgi:hypothetical protein
MLIVWRAASWQGGNCGNVYHADTLAFSFHCNGIAYTVTALPGSEDWLLPILQSWEFTD